MIQVLNRAFDILAVIAADPETPHNLGDLAERVELNAATCARILQTLAANGYVEQIAPKKGYILGPMAYALASKGPYRKHLVLAAEPVLSRLAQECRETVLLASLRGERRLVLCQVDGGQEVQIRGDRLQVYDPYGTATGRLLLAYLSEEELRSFVARRGLPGEVWPECGDYAALLATLARIREDGMVLRRTGGGVLGAAMPVREGDRVVASLGVYLPEHRFVGEHRERVCAKMAAAAMEISDIVSNRAFAHRNEEIPVTP